VNIAARLEGLAEPGGVCISGAVHSQVLRRLDAAFKLGGQQHLKNIAQPIEVWTWSSGAAVPTSDPGLELPDKPSLAVLPFLNLTGDADRGFIIDGFTEDLITAVSRVGALFVIARNSTFTYKDRPTDVKQIASELGVRYVIEGSIRQLTGKFRINAQLIDASRNHHIWAEVYDSDLESFDDDQDQIVRSIVASVQTQILMREGDALPESKRDRAPTEELLKRAWNRIYQMTPEALREAAQLAETALAESPTNDRAHQVLAAALFHLAYLGYTDDWDATIEHAGQAAERAVELFDAREQSHWVLGLVLMRRRDHDGAVAEIERALEINPNFSVGYGSLGTVLAWGGRAEEALRSTEMALRLNPRDPSNFFRFLGNALAHFTAGRYDEAAAWSTRAVRAKRIFRIPYLVRIAALALGGEIDRARSAARDMHASVPAVTRSYLDNLPFIRVQDREALVQGLETAGVLH
jgi:adenylate cyclase